MLRLSSPAGGTVLLWAVCCKQFQCPLAGVSEKTAGCNNQPHMHSSIRWLFKAAPPFPWCVTILFATLLPEILFQPAPLCLAPAPCLVPRLLSSTLHPLHSLVSTLYIVFSKV